MIRAMAADADPASIANELRVVLGQLVRRLRNENALPPSHIAVLSRLDRAGAQTTSGLAAAERMRPQSMAQTLADLRRDGLVDRTPDQVDRRQILVEMTARGRECLAAERRRREGWLAEAIAGELKPAERKLLADAVALLRRLAEL
jgi:DNA-binding MarR family transcriptional regulator